MLMIFVKLLKVLLTIEGVSFWACKYMYILCFHLKMRSSGEPFVTLPVTGVANFQQTSGTDSFQIWYSEYVQWGLDEFKTDF